MDLEQMMGRYLRLKRELSAAYDALPWNTARIDRLANELAATERDLAAAQGSSDPGNAHARARGMGLPGAA